MGDGSPREPLALRDFRSYWYADAIGAVGLAITPVVVDVLVVGVLDASETEVGLVRAAQFLPYLLVGLLAGACVDRWRRRPTLVVTNVAQGVLLLLVPALGRVNATRRSANRTAAVLGALLAGALAGGLGYRRTIGLAVVIFLVAVLVAVCSPLRRARTGDLPDAPS